jgi:hypothetical protein
MTDQDKQLLEEFRDAREKYDTASLVASGESTPATQQAAIAVYRTLEALRDLEDESLRKLADEALQYWDNDYRGRGQIAQQLLMLSCETPSHNIN